MGYAQAIGIAATDMSLESKVSWHFQSNCYPPVPQFMVPIAVEAVRQAVEGNWDEVLELPEGVAYRNQPEVSVGDIVDSLHLGAFVEAELWDDEQEDN